MKMGNLTTEGKISVVTVVMCAMGIVGLAIFSMGHTTVGTMMFLIAFGVVVVAFLVVMIMEIRRVEKEVGGGNK